MASGRQGNDRRSRGVLGPLVQMRLSRDSADIRGEWKVSQRPVPLTLATANLSSLEPLSIPSSPMANRRVPLVSSSTRAHVAGSPSRHPPSKHPPTTRSVSLFSIHSTHASRYQRALVGITWSFGIIILVPESPNPVVPPAVARAAVDPNSIAEAVGAEFRRVSSEDFSEGTLTLAAPGDEVSLQCRQSNVVGHCTYERQLRDTPSLVQTTHMSASCDIRLTTASGLTSVRLTGKVAVGRASTQSATTRRVQIVSGG